MTCGVSSSRAMSQSALQLVLQFHQPQPSGTMSKHPTSVGAGGEHTLLYNANNKTLFSAGACGLGWCRQHPITDALFALRKVQLGGDDDADDGPEEPCKLFYASYYHNLAVGANTGKLYSWGCGTFIEGGLDGVIPALGQGRDATDLGQSPKPIHLPTSSPIVQLSGGAYHSIVLTASNQLYTFGAGQLGQLGRPTAANDASGLPVDPTPGLVTGIPPAENIQQIGSGFYNTLAACRSGNLYCAGENQNQQCGSGVKNLREMTRVKEVEGVEIAQGGYCHTLIKTVAGKVLSMGCGEEGQRGIGKPVDDDDEELVLPVIAPINLPGGQKAKQIAAGANHSVVLGENGVAYIFGANDVGQCGVPSDDDEDEGGPVWAPKAVDIPGKVVEVSAGYAHTVVTTATGQVYTFGQNDNGQLGIGRNGMDQGEDCGPSLLPVEVKLENEH